MSHNFVQQLNPPQMSQTRCSHCKTLISSMIIATHQAYCFKFHVTCDICQEMYDIKDLDQHNKLHEMVKCKFCPNFYEGYNDIKHQKVCPAKNTKCDYCHQFFKNHEFLDHVVECGGRNGYCNVCGIKMYARDLYEHLCVQDPPKSSRQKLIRKMSESSDCQLVDPIKYSKLGEEDTIRLKKIELYNRQKERKGQQQRLREEQKRYKQQEEEKLRAIEMKRAPSIIKIDSDTQNLESISISSSSYSEKRVIVIEDDKEVNSNSQQSRLFLNKTSNEKKEIINKSSAIVDLPKYEWLKPSTSTNSGNIFKPRK